jgi:hypothetical protein
LASGNFQRHSDVVGDVARVQQVKMLKDHPGAQAISAARLYPSA